MEYKGKIIGIDITTFVDLFAIIDDPEASEEQREAAREEVALAMDDFS